MTDSVARRPAAHAESVRASRSWWDGAAAGYHAEHGAFLGDDDLVWGPEGIREADLGLLGDLRGVDVLEFGAGAGQGARWCAAQGARAIATDLSLGMLRQGAGLDRDTSPRPSAYLQCDAALLPLAHDSVDVAFSAYGALPFVADSLGLLRECARVLRPGGRLVFSVTHPFRWSLPDVPGEEGLVLRHPYFDRRPYVEEDASGNATYVEHHRTLGDRVRELRAAGLVLDDLVEPEWPQGARHTWGGWSPLRGRLVPGTAIFAAHLPRHG